MLTMAVYGIAAYVSVCVCVCDEGKIVEMSGNRGTEAFPCYGLTRDSTNCSLVCACVCVCVQC